VLRHDDCCNLCLLLLLSLCVQVGLGEHNIVPNYFEQNQAEALDPQLTVLDTLIHAAPDAKLNDLKQLLGRMLFSGTAMDKKVRVCILLVIQQQVTERLWIRRCVSANMHSDHEPQDPA